MGEAGWSPTKPCENASAVACRVLAVTGLVEHILGHVSARTGPDGLLVRGRGPAERGLAFTVVDDVRQVSLDGTGTVPSGWKTPSELPIHTEIMRSRPEVTAVVHAHPPAVVAASVADLPWLPLTGAYDIPAARLAHDGIPVWPRSALIRRRDLAEEMTATLGDRPVVVLRGHGLVAVGTGDPAHAVAEAVTRAVAVDSLARTMLAVTATGAPLRPVPDEDIDELPDLGPAFTVTSMWRHLTTRAEHEGPGTPLRA
ncbi:class II aldolase/adducin family protein [Streptomyces tagetis]|uniref:Class II aldolase/adducin family protein n=1 Tax=Streptomyces tagetis TaxID=2820809 RepID=A0A941B1C6_9ACTN|nr:class II aldolase/adducin family protein [Streptomyces sp. RG38]MBQ0825987.1 class II aldolase/adducin family protein [Streptomyces sp. RG38]